MNFKSKFIGKLIVLLKPQYELLYVNVKFYGNFDLEAQF